MNRNPPDRAAGLDGESVVWLNRDWSGIMTAAILAVCLAVAGALAWIIAWVLEAIDAVFMASVAPAAADGVPVLGWWFMAVSIVFLGLALWVLVLFVKWIWPHPIKPEPPLDEPVLVMGYPREGLSKTAGTYHDDPQPGQDKGGGAR